MSTSFRIAAVAAAAALALSACGSDGDGAGADGDGLKIGIKFDQPGLGLKDGENYTGMDVEVAKKVAEGLGVAEDKITWVQAPSPQREQLLKTGQVDMIFATYSITDKRKAEVSFAGPYFVAGQSLLVGADSDITGLDDSLDGKLLCSVTGSTSAEKIKEEIPGVELQEYGTYSECAAQVANGTLDALTTDDAILAGYAAQDTYKGKLKLVGGTFSTENYGVGLPKDSEQCEEINEILNGLWEDGTMEQIISDNLGEAGYEYNKELNPPEAGGNC
ncbi:glutamate ABC transporter substrate-binding protein [Ornithinimicrobium tianjinense]|uniref:ABC transporter substrate-binding protein n=1 Tax=Ornithinimicrobium tianjinense TaxID=1195761 RepID=A0A917BPE7_9MICO|nr:glutamate ABC transporter substrate-binding protein [Ornithinimicrobium tianjinense]GGF49149.1 ABC transporter substrate-binding protein [Ornithinimicrobium tianjinense]